MQEKLEKIDFFYRDKKKICFHKKRHFSADFFKKEKKLSEQNRRFVIRENISQAAYFFPSELFVF